MKTVYTLGYEGASLTDFIGTIIQANIAHVLDIRELPQSRRPGFSKKALSAALSEVGVGYSHVKQLGDPKHGREAARAGRMEEFRMIFEAHLDLADSKLALEEVAATVEERDTVLMCYERNPTDCHRSLVANRLVGLRSLRVQHLGVRPGARTRIASISATADRHA